VLTVAPLVALPRVVNTSVDTTTPIGPRSAVMAASYFDGAGVGRALVTLGLWITGAAIALSAAAARRRRLAEHDRGGSSPA
jgi:hypothetical protein